MGTRCEVELRTVVEYERRQARGRRDGRKCRDRRRRRVDELRDRTLELRCDRVADVPHDARPIDHHVLRCHAEMELLGDAAVAIERDRDGELLLRDERAHVLDRIVDTDVDRVDGELVAVRAKRGLEVRHLRATRHAPRRPELQIDRPPTDHACEIDARAVEQLERDRRQAMADERVARRLHERRGLALARCRRPRRGQTPLWQAVVRAIARTSLFTGRSYAVM